MAREHVVSSGLIGQRLIDWRASLIAGLAGGLAFLLLQMFLVVTVELGSPWAPLHMMASIVLGRGVLDMPALNVAVLVTGLIVHFVLAMIYGVAFGFAVHRWHMGLARWSTTLATAVGGVFGIALFALNFFAFTQVFPWFAQARDFVTLFDHIVFGAITGLTYAKLAQARRNAQPAG